MKIECPKCQTGGKLDPTRVPDTGANIRCPSCGAVFFVEKPAADAEQAAASRKPSPTETVEAVKPVVDTAAADEAGAPADERGAHLDSASEAAASGTAATSDNASATAPANSPGTVSGRPAAPALGSSGVHPPFRMTLSQPMVDGRSSGGAPTKTTPPPPKPEPQIPRRSSSSSHSRLQRISAMQNAGASHPWKVKNTSGMVYDFPDTKSVKTWLEGRTTHSDLELSPDGGDSWKPMSEFVELKDLQPRGLRSSSLRLSGGLERAAADALQSGPSAGASGRADYRSGAVRPTRSGESIKADSKATSAASKNKKGEPKPKTKRAREAEAELEKSRRNFRIGTGLAILIACAIGWFFVQKNEARQTLPDTPAGHQLEWVLEALNGDAAEMASAEVEQHFVASSLSVAGQGDVGRGARLILNELRFWQDQYPHYQFDSIVGRATPTYLEAQLATSVGEAGIVGLEVERDPPHSVISLWIRPAE